MILQVTFWPKRCLVPLLKGTVSPFKGSKFNKVGNYISYYRLEDDEISWGGESDETKQGHIRKTEGYINRLSGEIDFDILKFNTQYEVVYGQFIKGKCAKKERAF